MTQHDSDSDREDLEKLLTSLQQLLKGYPRLMEELRVSVKIPQNLRDARRNELRAAVAVEECDPPCPPHQECTIDAFTLQWYCD